MPAWRALRPASRLHWGRRGPEHAGRPGRAAARPAVGVHAGAAPAIAAGVRNLSSPRRDTSPSTPCGRTAVPAPRPGRPPHLDHAPGAPVPAHDGVDPADGCPAPDAEPADAGCVNLGCANVHAVRPPSAAAAAQGVFANPVRPQANAGIPARDGRQTVQRAWPSGFGHAPEAFSKSTHLVEVCPGDKPRRAPSRSGSFFFRGILHVPDGRLPPAMRDGRPSFRTSRATVRRGPRASS